MRDPNAMNKPGRQGLARIVAAAGYSWLGFKAAWANEAAFRQESLLVLISIPCAFMIAQNAVHLLLLLLCGALVLLAELINSAIEAIVDRIGSDYHPLSGQAKDIGSAAVFVALSAFALCWGYSVWSWLNAEQTLTAAL